MSRYLYLFLSNSVLQIKSVKKNILGNRFLVSVLCCTPDFQESITHKWQMIIQPYT